MGRIYNAIVRGVLVVALGVPIVTLGAYGAYNAVCASISSQEIVEKIRSNPNLKSLENRLHFPFF